MSTLANALVHPTLQCTLLGKPSTSTIQFRNLKYASISSRYKESFLHDSLRLDPNGTFDATRFGPSCPQKRGAQPWDLSLIGNVNLAAENGQGDSEKMDEFECLHLNVTVPNNVIDEQSKARGRSLPVFVWVHGGALSMGSNSWPQYDLRRFVERSVEIEKPVIGVALNYRLGPFGFLASEEVGVDGNMGFKDQVLAFRWIKKHIAGFGGDPSNITAAGESAGGISLSTLLCSTISSESLFDRVVIMSGETTLRNPRNRWWHEQMYRDQFKYLGLERVNAKERRKIMLETSAEELTEKLPLAQHFCGCVDGKWLKEHVTLGILADGKRIEHKPAWCREFVIGDTAHDGTVLKARVLDNPRAFELLKELCSRLLTASETHDLMLAYNLIPKPSPEQEKESLLFLASELRFYLPAVAVSKGWKTSASAKNARRYHFHVPNPVEGAFTNLSSHELDVAFLLQNFDKHFDETSRKVGKKMADQFIRFIHGEGWATEGNLIVFDKSGVREVDESLYDQRYRNGRGKVLEQIGPDRLWKLAEAWQGVRSEDEENVVKVKL